MLTESVRQKILGGLSDGSVVPYLGPQALAGVRDAASGRPIPADSESLILALNGGKPMAPRLMYEFPRAAMNLELKKGRAFVVNTLTSLYDSKNWTESGLHTWLSKLNLPYVIDTNRDLLLQNAYADRPHTLILGVARVTESGYRFRLFERIDGSYVEKSIDDVDPQLPVLFKPLGSPSPEPTYVASDADFVDYITELMGGFAIPKFLKQARVGKKYLVLGVRFTRDTERMILTEVIHDAAPEAGWVYIPDPTPKEARFCERMGLQLIQAPGETLLLAS